MAGQAVQAREETPQRKGREGARWINERPTPEEFGQWAADNIPIAEGLDIGDYLGGIVLIPAVDNKSKYVSGFKADGQPIISERPEMVYIPYAKVEARLQYFWDLLELADNKWRGVIEPIVTERPQLDNLVERVKESLPPRATVDDVAEAFDRELLRERETYKPTTAAAIVHQLPPGFFLMPVPVGGEYAYFLCCSYRVAIYEKDAPADARPIREGRGTKQVALVVKKWRDAPLSVDENAIMKAETGAIGRALGAAGIFTIPGSGIATAEDMLDQAAGAPAGASAETASEGAGPAAPAEPPAPRTAAPAPQAQDDGEDAEEVLERCVAIVGTLQQDFPDAYEAFGQWCSKRRPKITELSSLSEPALRGVRTKLEKLLAEAVERQAARGEGDEPRVPPETAGGAHQASVAPEGAHEPAVPPERPEGQGDGPALV